MVVCPTIVHADGGTLVFYKQVDRYRISLFTAPTSLRPGLVDFSVLIQSADSDAPLLDVPVTIHVYPSGKPQWLMGGPATRAAATNKLFRAIQLDLSEPGMWQVEVEVGDPAQLVRVDAALEVGPPLPSWIELLPWIGWPVVAILLFAVHQGLVRRQNRRVTLAKVQF